MEEIEIVDNYMDDREFRNYVHTMFYKNGFKYLRLDDSRVSDEYPENDNDLKVTRDGKRYTVQTYLNTKISEKEIEETEQDMLKEKLEYGIIVTNFHAGKIVREKALEKNIIILDRKVFEDGVYI